MQNTADLPKLRGFVVFRKRTSACLDSWDTLGGIQERLGIANACIDGATLGCGVSTTLSVGDTSGDSRSTLKVKLGLVGVSTDGTSTGDIT